MHAGEAGLRGGDARTNAKRLEHTGWQMVGEKRVKNNGNSRNRSGFMLNHHFLCLLFMINPVRNKEETLFSFSTMCVEDADTYSYMESYSQF